jgi:D-alanine-D-alanine ligase-like ATP-grasp enzyme
MSPRTGLPAALLRLGRPGLTVAQELADVTLLGPRLWSSQRRDPTAARLAGAVREGWYRRMWTDAARALGADLQEGPGDLLAISLAGQRVRAWGQFLSLDDPVTLRLAGDKPATHEVLRREGLTVPEHVALAHGDASPALRLLERHECLVVKPAAATGAGQGITGGVRNARDLRRALLRAAPHDSRRALVECQSSGDEVRVLVVRGQPLAVVRRRPPTVVGDGSLTVADLVRAENLRRQRAEGAAGLFALSFDLDAMITLSAQGYAPRSVPPSGRRVRVKSGSSQGSDLDATAVPVASRGVEGVVADAIRAAHALEADFVSVEFITPDPARTTAEAGVVLEVNTTPGLAQHYVVDNPGTTPDAAQLTLGHLLGQDRGS